VRGFGEDQTEEFGEDQTEEFQMGIGIPAAWL
jgi:hypothetical protein